VFGHIIAHVIATWGYYAVFGLTALEGFGFFFLPGETTLIAAAIVAAETHHLNIIVVLAAGFCGGILGDNFSFWVGHKFGFRALRRYGHYLKLNLKRLKFVQYLYLRYGRPIVFVGRFVMLLRSWESFLAGANAMPWRRFAPVNAAAILVWVCAWGLGAYGIGQASESLLEPIIIGIGIVVCLLLVAGWIYFRRHEAELEARSEKALPGPLQARREKTGAPVAT
jgi:membrane protein DedA with SNARE-associated domain